MKSTGMSRKIDELGRIVIPMEIRNSLGIQSRDALEIFVENDMIVLKKDAPACLFCGGEEQLSFFRGKQVCRRCLDELQRQL